MRVGRWLLVHHDMCHQVKLVYLFPVLVWARKSQEKAVTENQKRWYHFPMVWMVIAIPLSAVIVGAILMTLSITTFDGLVEDDYYKKGKEINAVLERDEFALEQGIKAQIQIDVETGIIVVDLSSMTGYVFPQDMGLSLLHPTRSKKDVKLLLSKGPDGRYYSELLAPLSDGRWYLRIAEPNWRLQKLLDWPVTGGFELTSDS